MRLATFQPPGLPPEAGLLCEDSIIGFGTDMLSLCARGKLEEPKGSVYRLSDVTLLAPIPRPPKLLCVGVNYRDHAAEMKMSVPQFPNIFNKLPTTVVGPHAPIMLPKVCRQTDCEVELSFVIGSGGRHIPASRAMAHVFGFTILNDVTAREFHMVDSMRWLMGKNFDTFAPIGPCIVTAEQISDPHSLDISLEVNGQELQNSNTRELIFSIPELVEYISRVITLEPGDIVATGSPGGVGHSHSPPRYLKPGDHVKAWIAGIGELSNPVTSAAQTGFSAL